MLVDGTDPALIKQSWKPNLIKLKLATKVVMTYENAQDLAPAMGMIGTLVGLVIMLGNMSDPKSSGTAMAIAILTIVWGDYCKRCFYASSKKVEAVDTAETINNLMITDAVLFIQGGGNHA